MSEQQGFFDLSEAGKGEYYFVVDDPVVNEFAKLRDEMAKENKEKHAWYTMIFKIYPDGKFDFDFEYDHLPSFDIIPDPGDWLNEFERYPRPELQAKIQDWIDGDVSPKDWRLMVARLADLAAK